ncbi:MAG: dihydrolipoyl dehydrogenase [Acidimicrobiia bacterium]
MAEHFDVVILGGGPGGYAAALYGASAGLNIAMVEEARVGGTCLHQGCIPAKELLQTAEVLRTVRGAKEFGIDAGQPTIDLATSLARKQQVVDRLTKGLEGLLKGRNVTVVPGTGTVVDAAAHHVRVSDGTELVGNALILATGSAPRSIPGFDFDGERILSSDHVLASDTVPGRTAIIGGGAIGCEFASYLADVGSEVTVLEAMPSILPGVDPEVAKVVARAFKKRRISVETGVTVEGVDLGGVLTVRVHKGEAAADLEVDAVIVSVGRSPRSAGIGLEGSGVAVDARGFVVVDDHLRTAVPGVYAVGDLVATPALAHVGFAEAIVAIRTILGEDVLPIAYDRVPWGIYCHPEVAFAGLTEQAAIDRGHDVVTSVHRVVGNGRALIIGEPDGVVKIVSERDGPILGVHIAGPWATELIAEGYLAVNWEATADDLGALIHPHPTLSELFGESALALTGRSLH